MKLRKYTSYNCSFLCALGVQSLVVRIGERKVRGWGDSGKCCEGESGVAIRVSSQLGLGTGGLW